MIVISSNEGCFACFIHLTNQEISLRSSGKPGPAPSKRVSKGSRSTISCAAGASASHRILASEVHIDAVTTPTSHASPPAIPTAGNGPTTIGGLTMTCGQITSDGPMSVGPVCGAPCNSPPPNVRRVICASYRYICEKADRGNLSRIGIVGPLQLPRPGRRNSSGHNDRWKEGHSWYKFKVWGLAYYRPRRSPKTTRCHLAEKGARHQRGPS
jgi:hypothetical protein